MKVSLLDDGTGVVMRVDTRTSDGVAIVPLPRALVEMFRPELASLADEIVDEIRSTIPEYARPLDGPYGKSIRAGVHYAIGLFVEQIADPSTSTRDCHDLHRKLGQNEMREGRSLDALQAAHRVGARVSWRRIMRVGKRNGLSSMVMSQLADMLFAFMDDLASVALDGYLEAKACTAGALETWRRRLLTLILESPPAPARAIGELAQLTGWAVPSEVTPIAIRALPGSGHNQRRPMLDDDLLADLDGVEPHLLVPGELTPQRLARVRAALPDSVLAVGVGAPIDRAADSLRWARRVLALAEDGSLGSGRPPGHVIFCADHFATLLVRSDPSLVAQLRRRLFAPLQGMTVRQQERMLETLRAWLDAQGSVLDIAERLQVHPQTVRYRMRQLEAAFAGVLDDPEARFQLEVVLRAGPPVITPGGSERVGSLPSPRSSPSRS